VFKYTPVAVLAAVFKILNTMKIYCVAMRGFKLCGLTGQAAIF
jgi:hypothetical protein